jgi:hypothetical protein
VRNIPFESVSFFLKDFEENLIFENDFKNLELPFDKNIFGFLKSFFDFVT